VQEHSVTKGLQQQTSTRQGIGSGDEARFKSPLVIDWSHPSARQYSGPAASDCATQSLTAHPSSSRPPLLSALAPRCRPLLY
jgi:hypothetical protein